MAQRWLKTLMIFTASAVLFSACQKSVFSGDEPLDPKNTPSLFIGSQQGILYAFVPETGEKKWEANVQANIVACPVVVANKYLVVATKGNMFKLDVHTGKILRIYDGEAISDITGTPYVQGNNLYAVTVNGTVYAIDVAADKLKWTKDLGGVVEGAPAFYDGQLFVGTGNGGVRCINVTNGGDVWTAPLRIQVFTNPVVSPPNTLYVTDIDNVMYTLDLKTGTFRDDEIGEDTAAAILSSPIVYGGNIIYGSSDYNVYCIDSVLKAPRWVKKTGNRVISSPFAKDQTVYFGSLDYKFYAVDIRTGETKWVKETGALIKSSPLVHQGTVYIGGFDKKIYAFDTSGALKWSKNIDGLIETSPVLYDLNRAYYPSVTGFN